MYREGNEDDTNAVSLEEDRNKSFVGWLLSPYLVKPPVQSTHDDAYRELSSTTQGTHDSGLTTAP